MRIAETKVFTFDELSQEAKEVAIEKQRQWQYEYGEYLHFFQDTCEEHIMRAGFNGIKLQYSLSYCQGDGLSFSAESYDNLEQIYLDILGKGKEKTAKILADNTTFQAKGNDGRYCFASKSDIDMYLENWNSAINVTDTDNIDEVIEVALSRVEDIYMELCKELEDMGYAEIEYQNSDEVIIENIKANDYEFTEDGLIF